MISGKDILFIGHDLSDKGGISTLENSYNVLFEEYKHIAIYRYGGFISKIFLFLKGIYQIILSLIRDPQIRIIHIHTASGLDFYRKSIPLLIAYLFRKRIVLHVHGGYFPVFFQKFPKLNHFIIDKASSIITVSEFLRNNMLKLNLTIPIYNVYNIVDKADDENVRVRNLSGKIRLGFLGAINENKRIFDIVRMFVERPDLKSICNLRVAGVGDDVQLLKLISTYELESSIDYVGWVGKEEKIKFFNEVDMLLQPSDFESFGLSIAEAMSYGCPVIATNVGGIPEIIEDGVNGFLINPGDFDSLYKLIRTLSVNRELFCSMSKAAISSVTKFSEKEVAEKLKHVYQETV